MLSSNFDVAQGKIVEAVNTNLISKLDYNVGAEQKKASINDIVVRKVVHMSNLRRGRDGKIRLICGPGFADMAKVDNLKHNQIYQRVMPVQGLWKNRAKGESHQILPKMFVTYQGDHRTIKQNPTLAKVVPNFRTPPGNIRIGRFLLKLHACS